MIITEEKKSGWCLKLRESVFFCLLLQAYAANKVGVPVTIYVPQTTSPAKIKAVKQLGGSVSFHGEDCVEAEVKARSVSKVKVYWFVFNKIKK